MKTSIYIRPSGHYSSCLMDVFPVQSQFSRRWRTHYRTRSWSFLWIYPEVI